MLRHQLLSWRTSGTDYRHGRYSLLRICYDAGKRAFVRDLITVFVELLLSVLLLPKAGRKGNKDVRGRSDDEEWKQKSESREKREIKDGRGSSSDGFDLAKFGQGRYSKHVEAML